MGLYIVVRAADVAIYTLALLDAKFMNMCESVLLILTTSVCVLKVRN